MAALLSRTLLISLPALGPMRAHAALEAPFTRITTTNSIVTESFESQTAAWGDYDNDGFLDLFVGNNGARNSLFHNNGDGAFAKVSTGAVATFAAANPHSAAWADYDNDGWLDLLLTADPSAASKNRLYHNEGDGTFTKVTAGRLVTDSANPTGCAWGDYDNDGFLDVFVANGGFGGMQRNGLYHNNANSNSWIKVKCVGTKSNRSAIGTRVRVRFRLRSGALLSWRRSEIGIA